MSLRASVLLLSLATALRAASPQLSAINPPGAQRGAEVELTITGKQLGDAKGLLFYSPGFEVAALVPVDDGKFKAKLKVANDCALGEHALRVWTATGVSELSTIYVGPFPSVEAKENHDPAHAQPIALNTTVNGVIKEEEIDYFSVEAKRGQRITAEVEGMRLGRALFDPWLSISKGGRTLATNDDNALFLQDPLISLIAPEDGVYLIAVRESAWGGTDKCAYRLHVGTFPQPLAVYPAGGQTGGELAVKFIGDPVGEIAKKLILPPQANENFPAFAEQDGLIAPAANIIRVSPFPNVLESEPNDAFKQATGTDKPLPLAFNGIVGTRDDVDFFKFAAKKDQQLDVNVYARRLRSPLDSVLAIFDANGKQLASNDDSAGPDSYLRFKVPADGEYAVSVRDQLGRGRPAFVYRIEITPAAPDVALTIPEIVKDSQERQSVVVPRGNRYGALIRAKRSEFGGSLTLDPHDLPAGVGAAADAMSERVDTLPVVFEARADAPVAAALCDVSAKEIAAHFGQHVELVIGQPNNAPYYSTDVTKLPVVVAEAAPFKIEVMQPKVPLVQNGAMDLRVVVTRADGFNAPVNISMLWNPPGVGSQPAITIPADKNEATIPLSANDNAALHKWKTAVVASADTGKGAVWVSSQLFDMEIAKPFVTAQIERANTEQGQSTTLVCKLTQNAMFDGKAKIELLGLPNKVSAQAMEITSADNEVRFNVATDPASPAGQHKGLFCKLTILQNGEPIVSNIAQGGVLRIDKPAKEVAAK